MLTLGLDIGGTNIKAALIETEQDAVRVKETHSVPTEGARGADVILGNLYAAARPLLSARVETVALSSAGTVDWDSGDVVYATETLRGFTGLALSGRVSELFSRPVVAVNDAVAATVGEAFCGAGKPYETFLTFTLGTGLGASYLADRRLTAESVIDTRLGHYRLHPGGRLCSCGERGCAEQYVSATGLKANGKTRNVLKIFTSERSEYAAARAAFYRDFTAVIRAALKKYPAKAVIVGGGIVELRDYWWDGFLADAEGIGVPLLPAALGNGAGAIGAVWSALHGRFRAGNGGRYDV